MEAMPPSEPLVETVAEQQRPLAALRRFVRPRPKEERCELCGNTLPSTHQHLIEPATRRMVCSCDACAILFSSQEAKRFRRVPRRIQPLPDFHMTDGQWESLHLPINLAFFYHSSAAERVIAMYPSPAGAMESLLTFEAWEDLAVENPVLRQLEADVEALLVNRVGQSRQYFRVPIDECFKLVGLIRAYWRGLSGGSDVWEQINEFFKNLKATHA